MEIKIKYTGEEALEMIQKQFPKSWEVLLLQGIEKIKGYMRTFDLDATAAYQKFVNWCGKPDDAIVHLAALHWMNKRVQMATELKEIETQIMQVANQMQANEVLQSTSYSDRQMLRGFYSGKQTELNERYRNTLHNFPVMCFEEVVYQPKLL